MSEGVYPRVCGGATFACLRSATGLSPRVRGSRADSQRAIYTVYPRVCGGASDSEGTADARASGLSPRVRGSPRYSSAQMLWCRPRSIPACAGEPLSESWESLRSSSWRRSIPACAGEPGIPPWQSHNPLQVGLSPRVRGSRRVSVMRHGRTCQEEVYPRVCGEPSVRRRRESPMPCCTDGLSPRVRGSPVDVRAGAES